MSAAFRWSVAGVCCLLCLDAVAGPPPLWKYSYAGATQLQISPANAGSAIGHDINDHGEIVGDATWGDGYSDAFYYNGNFVNIGWVPDVHSSTAKGINNHGEVVGHATLSGSGELKAFYWKNWHPFTFLDSNPTYGQPYQWHTLAHSINDAGVIVGEAIRQPHPVPPPNTTGECYGYIPVRWQSSSNVPGTIFCPAAGGWAYASDINGGGVIVGGSDSATAATNMFRWSSGTRVAIPAPAPSAYAVVTGGTVDAINNSNAVVGRMRHELCTEGNDDCLLPVAFHWDGISTQSTIIGTLTNGRASWARDINSQGIVVGYSERRVHHLGAFHYVHSAFIWHPHFGMKTLPALPHGLALPGACQAIALNDRKSSGLVQVTGYCQDNNHTNRAVRWDVTIDRVYVTTTQ
jgi:probable HAF family extracellular repeat protein